MLYTHVSLSQISDDKSAEDFLSSVYLRNRPRVVLAFRFPSPPLPFLLAAFYLRDSLDFGFIFTGGDRDSPVSSGLSLGGVKVHYGDKQLLVFKESPVPLLVKNVSFLVAMVAKVI